MKIWTSRSSPRSGSQNAWTRIKTVNGAIRLINIWNFFGAIQMISCRDWWPWTKPGYITMTWRQTNNQCSGGIAAYPAPKFPSTKIRWKYLAFFEIKTAFSLLIIFQRAILSTLVQVEDILKGNRCGKFNKVVLYLHDNAPAHRAPPTQNTLANLGFQCLDHPSQSPDPAPTDHHLLSGLKKTNEGSTLFDRRVG